MGYEEIKRITKDMREFVLDKVLDFDLEEIFMYCAVNCIKNPYITNYIKKRKQIEDEENTNEREETSQYPPIISYDESGNEEEPYIQPISSIRSSEKRIKPTHDVKKKKDGEAKVERYPSQMMLLLLLIVMMIIAILLVISILLMMRVIMLMI